MATFICKLGSPEGVILQQELEASDEQQLRSGLATQGYHVFSVKRKGMSFPLIAPGLHRRRIDNRELLEFNQELVVLLKAGMPIVPVLDAILEHRSKSGSVFVEVMTQVREDVKSGSSLSAALERHEGVFPPLYLASVRAGERTGDMPHTIRRYILFLKRAEELRKKVIAALFYPTILIVVAIAAIVLLLVYVVPTFSQVYEGSGSQLPLLTRLLIAGTDAFRSTALLWFPGMVLILVVLQRWKCSERGRNWIDRWKLQLPVVGELFLSYSIAGFSRTLATLLGSGIPIVESLRMALGTLANRHLEKGMMTAIRQVEDGGRLSVALEELRLMPPLALRMLGVGESTGSLEEMLSDIAEHLEAWIEERLRMVTTAIEPAVMVVMGLVIGFIILAMYLPIFKLAATVG